MKKYFLIRLLVVCIFITISYMICDLTKYYIPPIYYRKDEIRMVIDDTEVTRNLPQEVIILNDKVMLSFDTIEKYFDKYIYFDKQYKTIIITNSINILKMKLYDNKINLNGEEKEVDCHATEINEEIYIPIEILQDMYDIKVENNEKVIITTADATYKEIKMNKNQNIKLYKKELSLTTGKIKKDENLVIFSGDANSEYVRVRTPRGDLGYISKKKLKEDIIFESANNAEKNIQMPKINLTWEYAENYTPNRMEQSKINGLDVISPTWIYLKNSSGEIKYNTISNEYITWAKSKGYKLWPTLKNDSMGLDKTSDLVTDMRSRENLINNVVALAKRYKFDGINLDFEFMKKEDKGEFSQFVREFSATLRRNGLVSTVDVNVPDGSDNWSLCYEHKPISDACDYMILMAYDQYGIKQNGPIASLSWVETNINKLIEREKVDNSKFILGVPFYSKYRKDKVIINGDEETYTNLSSYSLYMQNAKNYLNNEKYRSSATWSDELGQYYIEYRNNNIIEKIWIEDENALKEKAQLVNKYKLAGIASWRWGFETKEAWQVIENTLTDK